MEITKRRLADIVPYSANAKSMISGKSTTLRRASSSTDLYSRL
nr:MAG TPA_asm: Dynamin family [Caudoviricetes sp.]